MIKITKAEFLTSSPDLKRCPELNLPEVALIGRSNVGKSSFINALTNRKKLAHTSNTPGKTRLINLYNINDKIVIADLPGYGYAKVSKKEQQQWAKNLEDYLLNRKDLKCVIQLIDARHDVQQNDLQMREWLDHYQIETITMATKIDVIKKAKIASSLKKISDTFDAEVIGFSAKTGYGKDKILNTLLED